MQKTVLNNGHDLADTTNHETYFNHGTHGNHRISFSVYSVISVVKLFHIKGVIHNKT